MKLYSFDNQYPIEWQDFPNSIRLSNGMLRTDKSSFTNEEIVDAGWTIVEQPLFDPLYEDIVWNIDSGTFNIVLLSERQLYQRKIHEQLCLKINNNYEEYKQLLEQKELEGNSSEAVLNFRSNLDSFDSDLRLVEYNDGTIKVPSLDPPLWLDE